MAMTYLDGVLSQPDNLAGSADTVEAELAAALPSGFEHPATSVLLTGMGASLHAAVVAAVLLRARGRRAWAVSATDVLDEPRPEVLGDVAVAVSQSGRSAETAAAVDRLPQPTVAVCNEAAAPVATRVDRAVRLGSMPDTAISTLSYTATVQALGMLADRMTAPAAGRAGTTDWWTPLPDLVRLVLDQAAAATTEAAQRWADVTSVDVVGRGSSVGSAGETALLLREAVRLPATAMDTLQYLHGPMEVAESGRAAVVFGAGREVSLAESLAGYGCDVLLVTTADVASRSRLTVVRLPSVSAAAIPVLEILPLQLLTWYLARCRGLAVEGFRYEQPDTKLSA
jgi:glucosamine--fructose-6-phosphate aminotransferase (isomerizing)